MLQSRSLCRTNERSLTVLQAASEQDNVQAPTRSIQKEEEILLLYDIVETHGTAQDFEKLTSSSVYCPLTHFRQGRKEVFLRVIAKYRRSNDWEAVYRLCKDCLSENVEEGRASLLASDYHVWEEFIGAASHIVGVDEA